MFWNGKGHGWADRGVALRSLCGAIETLPRWKPAGTTISCPGCRAAEELMMQDEVVDGIPVRAKRKPKFTLEAWTFVRFEDGSVWEVESVRPGGADVRCVRKGKINVAGHFMVISSHSSHLEKLSDADVEALKSADAEAKAEAKALDSGVHEFARPADGLVDGRDTEGLCFKCGGPQDDRAGLHKTGPRQAPLGRGWHPTAEETAKVLELRAGGMGYAAIEKEMGWPDGHGNRPWKIVKEAGK